MLTLYDGDISNALSTSLSSLGRSTQVSRCDRLLGKPELGFRVINSVKMVIPQGLKLAKIGPFTML